MHQPSTADLGRGLRWTDAAEAGKIDNSSGFVGLVRMRRTETASRHTDPRPTRYIFGALGVGPLFPAFTVLVAGPRMAGREKRRSAHRRHFRLGRLAPGGLAHDCRRSADLRQIAPRSSSGWNIRPLRLCSAGRIICGRQLSYNPRIIRAPRPLN